MAWVIDDSSENTQAFILLRKSTQLGRQFAFYLSDLATEEYFKFQFSLIKKIKICVLLIVVGLIRPPLAE